MPNTKKLYFLEKCSEYCYPLSHFVEYMNKNGLPQMEVFEAEITKCEPGIFFCKAVQEFGQRGPGYINCGTQCQNYKPRNGKSGACKNYSKLQFEPSEKPTILKCTTQKI